MLVAFERFQWSLSADFAHSAAVNTVDYSPDGKTIVSGSEDGTAKIWEATTGKCVTTIGGDSGPVATVNYSPNGKSIVLCYRRTGKIQILDASSGECIKTLEESAALVRYSSDGKYIVGGVDNTVKIWEVSSGKCIKTYEIGATYGGMLSVDISPDGKKITSGSEDNGLRTWLTPWASASEANRVKSAPEFDRCDVAIGLMLKKSSWFDWDVKKLKKEKTKEGFKYSNSNGLVEFFINKEPDGTYKIKVQTDSMIQYCFVEVDTKTARWLK